MDADTGLAARRGDRPLLANIYLDPLDLVMAARGYRMVRYADDFVILCRTREEAEAALEDVRAWGSENGLALHPEKTHVGDCRQPGQGFEFLGYRFEAGQRHVRKKSLTKLKDSIRAKTKRTRGDTLARIVADLNSLLPAGSPTSSTPIKTPSKGSTDSPADGCAPFSADRRSGRRAKTARPVVCPAKAGMFSRRKACRGKSQEPRSLDSRVAGNQDSEAYRQRLPREDDESPGRNDSERKSGSKVRSPEGRVLNRRAKAAWGSRNLTDAAPSLRRGGSDSTVARTC